MKPRMDEVIAYEVKKDIAERYFGFRKLIETDKQDIETKIKHQSFVLEKRISFDLIRMYILLKDQDIIDSFLDIVSLDKELFYDPFFKDSSTIRQRVFEGVEVRGFTKSGKFKHLVLDCYERLETHISQYREKFAELQEANETIAEEIKVFYQQNDLGSILGFLRSLGSTGTSGALEGGMEMGLAQSLEKKMAVPPPLPIEHFLPVIEPLPSMKSISKELKKLINRAYHSHDKQSLEFLISEKPSPIRR